jgi:flagellar protein FlgJ
MLRPDFAAARVSAELARERASIALPSMSAANAPRKFDALLGEIRREIDDFISDSSAAAPRRASRSTALTVEARALLAKMQDAQPGVHREQQQEFLASIAPLARQAAERLGVAPELIAAHAALESGWGQRPLRGADGSVTHNLFGIKAGQDWTGGIVRALTTEVDDGRASTRTETFRSYASLSQAFDDYAQLLLNRSRYAHVVNAGDDAAAFASGLAQGRYATDPDYAAKIERVARQVREIGLPATSVGGGIR